MTRPDDQPCPAPDEVERVGRPDGGEAALRRHSRTARSRPSGSTARPSGRTRAADQVRLRPSALSGRRAATLGGRIVGAELLHLDDHGRLLRAGGKSTLDLLRRKDSGVQDAPDAVLLPRDDERSPRSSGTARDHSIAVVPFGGGTTVVGGLDPDPRRVPRPWSRSTCARLDRAAPGLDEVSGEAGDCGAGLTGPGAPNACSASGASRWAASRRASSSRRSAASPATAVVGSGLGGLWPLQRHGPRPAPR